MTFLYIPKCKPFYKFSLLTLQIQVGLKCNLAQTKGFGLSAIKTNIRDTFGVPDGLYDFFGLENEQNLTESCQEPLILNVSIHHSTTFSATRISYHAVFYSDTISSSQV